MKTESKETQYAGYLAHGGTMTIEQWENDGRYDRYLAGPIFTFESDIPDNCRTSDQAKAVIKCRFQKELDSFFDLYAVNFHNEAEKERE
jgi:hypothetical protein